MNDPPGSQPLTEQRPSSTLEAFAAIEKRFRRIGLISAFGLVMFFLSVILGVALSWRGPLVFLLVVVSWLTIVGGIVAANLVLRCPSCNSHATRSKGEYCPECGARPLTRGYWWSPRTCAACGRVLRYRKSGRLFKVRYCSHCGCHLHERGL
jgi:hypothetical protein